MATTLALSLRGKVRMSVLVLEQLRDSHFERELCESGVELVSLGKKPGVSLRVLPELRKCLAGLQPDIVHSHLRASAYVLAAQPSGREYAHVHTLHTLAPYEQPAIGRAILRHLGKHVYVVPIAEAVRRSASKEGYCKVQESIPNGIEMPAHGKVRIRSSAVSNVLVTVGRLSLPKNHRNLLDAMKIVSSTIPNAKLLIAGDGPLRSELEEHASRLNLSVEFCGVLENVDDVLQLGDVFVLSSDYEGHPLAVLEAMCRGLPVVATNVGGVPEILESGSGGILVPPRDSPALAAAIRLALEPGIRETLSRHAVLRAQSFSAETMAESYLALYQAAASIRTREEEN